MTEMERAVLARNTSLALAGLDYAALANTLSVSNPGTAHKVCAAAFAIAIPFLVTGAIMQQLRSGNKVFPQCAFSFYCAFAGIGTLCSLVGIGAIMWHIAPGATKLFVIASVISPLAVFVFTRMIWRANHSDPK